MSQSSVTCLGASFLTFYWIVQNLYYFFDSILFDSSWLPTSLSVCYRLNQNDRLV